MVWHPKALCWLSKDQVHAVMLLFINIQLFDSIGILHHRDIRAINGGRVGGLVELRRVVHKRGHVWIYFPRCSSMHRVIQTCQVPGKRYILVSLNWANLAKRARKIPRRMHFLHDRSHGWGCLVLHLLLFEYIPRDPTFVFLLQRFVFQKVWSHDPVDLFEILEDCESGRFFFAWHVLRQVVVRI